ncbi:MAG: hypothetical protein U5Q03_01970 [Bacteroidota bacterium]|nr:hypothetical protein [Bacteroidota bacterium]
MNDFTGDYGDVAAITLNIDFDSDLMAFTGISRRHKYPVQWVAQCVAQIPIKSHILLTRPMVLVMISMANCWTWSSDYLGGFSGDLEFASLGCEIANTSTGANLVLLMLMVVLHNQQPDGTVSMDDLTELIGNSISMPVDIVGIPRRILMLWMPLPLMISYDPCTTGLYRRH